MIVLSYSCIPSHVRRYNSFVILLNINTFWDSPISMFLILYASFLQLFEHLRCCSFFWGNFQQDEKNKKDSVGSRLAPQENNVKQMIDGKIMQCKTLFGTHILVFFLSIYLYIYLLMCLSVYLSIYLSVYLSLCLSVYMNMFMHVTPD